MPAVGLRGIARNTAYLDDNDNQVSVVHWAQCMCDTLPGMHAAANPQTVLLELPKLCASSDCGKGPAGGAGQGTIGPHGARHSGVRWGRAKKDKTEQIWVWH